MKLPKNVDRMHIGLSTSAAEGGAVALIFDSKRCARDWLANSPLWGESRSSSPTGEMSAVMRTRWTHGDFEGRMAISGRSRPTEAEADLGPPKMDRDVRPTADDDVMGLALNEKDGYYNRQAAQGKPFWIRR
jgi:hypothetical protein